MVSKETQLQATRPVVNDWWRWSVDIADSNYQRWLKAHPTVRVQLAVTEELPGRYFMVEMAEAKDPQCHTDKTQG